MSGKHPRKGEKGWKSRAGDAARSGKRDARVWTAPFLAWDGEGATVDGTHLYTLLANSAGTRVWRDEGIDTELALVTLVAGAKARPGHTHVCYGASYDVNMMLGDLSAESVRELWRGNRVDFGAWELEYRPRKSFTVREWGKPRFVRSTRQRRRWVSNFSETVVLWDVIGFFQGPFVDAVAKYLGPSWPDLKRIREGKARRGTFALSDRANIEPYTDAELRTLVALMEELRRCLHEAELPITRWDGAGAIAASLLRREHVKDSLADLPEDIERAAVRAYAGGRMEVARYGSFPGPVHHYDLNSAYPSATIELPSLEGARWNRSTRGELPEEPFTLARVQWQLAMRDGRAVELFPFFYRESDGSICFPSSGSGWYWSCEVAAALELIELGLYAGSVRITETMALNSRARSRPFSFVPQLYAQREQWKREGRGAEKVLKLGTNSLYGKLAQQTGWSESRGKPPYHSIAWAGYITARTRAELLRAAAQQPRDVIMTATDGIYATAPLDLAVGSGLGQWTAHKHRGALVVQSGVYFVYDERDKAHRHRAGCASECEYEFRRGFDDGSITSAAVLRAWSKKYAPCDVAAHQGVGLHLDASSTRFVTMGSALAGGEQWSLWRSWRTIPRALALTPTGTKRHDLPGAKPKPADGPVRTIARAIPMPERESEPYPIAWRGEEWSERTVDGVDARIFAAEQQESAT